MKYSMFMKLLNVRNVKKVIAETKELIRIRKGTKIELEGFCLNCYLNFFRIAFSSPIARIKPTA